MKNDLNKKKKMVGKAMKISCDRSGRDMPLTGDTFPRTPLIGATRVL